MRVADERRAEDAVVAGVDVEVCDVAVRWPVGGRELRCVPKDARAIVDEEPAA